MTPDAELLRRYAETRSEAAFAELVNRHLGLVYSAALRQLAGDAHQAKDVAQMVFTDLARKAARLGDHPALSAWLYKSTRFAAVGVIRTENRRKNREREADAMREIHETSGPAVEWTRVGPVIDEVICGLNEREREAVCLRFLSGRTFGEIGLHTKVTADAARFRVERALEKMRRQLARRGVDSTAAALALALETQACSAAPAGMAAVIAGAATTGAARSGAFSLLKLMASYKQIAAMTALMIAAGAIGIIEYSRRQALQRQIASLSEQDAGLPALRAENRRLRALRASLTAGADAPRSPSVGATASRGAPAAGPESANALAKGGSGGLDRIDPRLLDQQPALLDRVAPTYPADLIGSGISATFRVELIVGADDGSGKSAIVKDPSEAVPGGQRVVLTPDFVPALAPAATVDLSNSARNELEAAAIEAANQWVFRPGRRGGRPVNTRLEVTMRVAPPATFVPPSQ